MGKEQIQKLNEIGGKRLVEGMIKLFLETSPLKVTAIHQAWEARDWPELERNAHSLKSSCAYLGEKKLGEVAARLESAAEKNEEAEVPALLSELDRYHQQALNNLRQHLQSSAE